MILGVSTITRSWFVSGRFADLKCCRFLSSCVMVVLKFAQLIVSQAKPDFALSGLIDNLFFEICSS